MIDKIKSFSIVNMHISTHAFSTSCLQSLISSTSSNLHDPSCSYSFDIDDPEVRYVWVRFVEPSPVPRGGCVGISNPHPILPKLERGTHGSRCASLVPDLLFHLSVAPQPAPPIGWRFDELTPIQPGCVLGSSTQQEGSF